MKKKNTKSAFFYYFYVDSDGPPYSSFHIGYDSKYNLLLKRICKKIKNRSTKIKIKNLC